MSDYREGAYEELIDLICSRNARIAQLEEHHRDWEYVKESEALSRLDEIDQMHNRIAELEAERAEAKAAADAGMTACSEDSIVVQILQRERQQAEAERDDYKEWYENVAWLTADTIVKLTERAEQAEAERDLVRALGETVVKVAQAEEAKLRQRAEQAEAEAARYLKASELSDVLYKSAVEEVHGLRAELRNAQGKMRELGAYIEELELADIAAREQEAESE